MTDSMTGTSTDPTSSAAAEPHHPASRGRVRVEPSPKRVRAYLGGQLVVDTTAAVLVWEVPYYPHYYLPLADLRAELVDPVGRAAHSPSRGDADAYTVRAGASSAAGAALRYPDSPIEDLRELVRIEFDAMDAWFEEDEQIYVHPRDPYTRVDILPSSRTIRVELDGVVLAESQRARLLFETGLPTRYYLPKTDARFDLLVPTDTRTGCPYKGTAEYWAVRIGEDTVPDLVWSYPTPLPESQKIAGLVAFYNEKLDIFVDGRLQQRPRTKFS
jgi:uncharacterized protein (DUF427 family)